MQPICFPHVASVMSHVHGVGDPMHVPSLSDSVQPRCLHVSESNASQSIAEPSQVYAGAADASPSDDDAGGRFGSALGCVEDEDDDGIGVGEGSYVGDG